MPLLLIEATERPSLIRGCTPAEVLTNSGSFTLSRTGPTTETLTVAYTVVGQVAPTGGSATFMVGEALVTVPLDPLPDATVLHITVELIDAEDYDLGDPSTATIYGAIAVPICSPPEPPEPPPVVVEPTFAG